MIIIVIIRNDGNTLRCVCLFQYELDESLIVFVFVLFLLDQNICDLCDSSMIQRRPGTDSCNTQQFGIIVVYIRR